MYITRRPKHDNQKVVVAQFRTRGGEKDGKVKWKTKSFTLHEADLDEVVGLFEKSLADNMPAIPASAA